MLGNVKRSICVNAPNLQEIAVVLRDRFFVSNQQSWSVALLSVGENLKGWALGAKGWISSAW